MTITAKVLERLDKNQLDQEYCSEVMEQIELASKTIADHFRDQADDWPGLVESAMTFVDSITMRVVLRRMGVSL
jgi:hypothetical protein